MGPRSIAKYFRVLARVRTITELHPKAVKTSDARLTIVGPHMLAHLPLFMLSSSEKATRFVDFLPLMGAILTLTAAVGVAAWNQYQSRLDRRRDLYSDAYRAVVSWAEMPYRVRRRDPKQPYEIVGVFHDLQESIDYHDGWISTESPELARAYRAFVRKVKKESAPAIKQAWAAEPCDPADGFSPPESTAMPDVETAKGQFLADVRDHLSFDPNRSRALRERYPERPRRQI